MTFPLTAQHVISVVKFANKHNLCVSVLGTGHDFMNRHDGCADGLLIRTTLLKSMKWDVGDRSAFGWKDGNVRVGSGSTFSEVHKYASIHMSIYMSIHTSIRRSKHVSIHISVHMSIHSFNEVQLYVSIHMSIRIYMCLYPHVGIHVYSVQTRA